MTMDDHQPLLRMALDHLEQALDILDRCESTHGVDVHVDMAIQRLSGQLAILPRVEKEVLPAGD